MLYSFEARALMERAIREQRPDVALLHNIYHQLSPSVLAPLRRHGVPAIMTLHDYKMTCPVYTHFRRGVPCERCRNGAYFRCAWGRCSKGSLPASLLAAFETTLHQRVLHLYDAVTEFVSPSRFLAAKLVELGFRKPIHHLPNFIDAGSVEAGQGAGERAFVYFGRLIPEKGLDTLVLAMADVSASCHIIGDGPLRDRLAALAGERDVGNVVFTPHVPFAELENRVRNARAVVLPSRWYENAPRSVLEAFALGKPVVGARVGGIPELVEDGVTGLTFSPGDVADLRRALLLMLSDKARVAAMGIQARKLVEERFGPAAYYDGLMALCERARARA
jgi:glycosyltransferase involved in cell wall biosynthesis